MKSYSLWDPRKWAHLDKMDRRQSPPQETTTNNLSEDQAKQFAAEFVLELVDDFCVHLKSPQASKREIKMHFDQVEAFLSSAVGDGAAIAAGLNSERLVDGLKEQVSWITTGYRNPIEAARAEQERQGNLATA